MSTTQTLSKEALIVLLCIDTFYPTAVEGRISSFMELPEARAAYRELEAAGLIEMADCQMDMRGLWHSKDWATTEAGALIAQGYGRKHLEALEDEMDAAFQGGKAE